MTRRDFFRQSAALGGSAGVVGTLLASVERALAIDPPGASSFLDAEHVVILMQENRSFDHMFGTLRGVRGFDDPRAVTLPGGKPVWLQTNSRGKTYAPFRLGLLDTKTTWLGSLPHSWPDQTDARNQGNHDGWLEAKKSHRADCADLPLTMGFYDRRDLPFYYALADAFTICDQHFCSSLTATTPNRLYLWTGTLRGKVRNADVDYGSTVNWKTFPERLEEAGVSWRIYQNELSAPSGLAGEADAWLSNFTDNPLEWFDQYRVQLRKPHWDYLGRMTATLPAEIQKLRAEGDPQRKLRGLEKLLEYAKAQRARWTPEALARIPAHERALHEKAFTTNEGDPGYRELSTLRWREGADTREMAIPKGDPLYRFRRDIADGKLPVVSWLVPSERLSDHPGSPWYGAWYVAEALNALTRNPDVWRKTIFILTYDENDGYFDHVPPFVAPEPGNPESGKTTPGIDASLEFLTLEQDLRGHAAKDARGGPIGLGFRVPLIVASPWSRGGYVCSQVFDHTSLLRLLERVASRRTGKEIRETNISDWRRTVCGDLTTAFRPFDAGAARVDFAARDPFFEGVHHAQFMGMPSGYGDQMPRQEPGVRPSTALPYELAANGALSGDGKRFEIVLEAKKAGAPFHIYTPGTYRGRLESRTRAYAVTGGERLTDSWDLEGFEKGAYYLRVCGPNGFLREFAGTAADPKVAFDCDYTRGGDLRIESENRAGLPLTIQIRDEAYGAGTRTTTLLPGERLTMNLDLTQSHRWYDFRISIDRTIEGAENFLRRYAGRVENGEDGFSDPAIGIA